MCADQVDADDMRDSHSELPLDPDSTRPLHHRPVAWMWVFAGGFLGTGLRWLVEQAFPSSSGEWPWATYGVNIGGAFVLGALLEMLVWLGADSGWRQQLRLFAGTGLCGAFTTYSTLALEVSLVAHHGAPWVAAAYGLSSVVVGVLAAAGGIAVGGRVFGRRDGAVT